MGRRRDTNQPTLAEAWQLLGQRLGLRVESTRDDAVRAQGRVRDRDVAVQVERSKARSEGWRFLAGINTISSRNRRDSWHTVVAVSCANPARLEGAIRSAVDTDDPAWNPREYNPRNGRFVRSDPPALAPALIDAALHEQLMSVMDDVVIHVGAESIVIDDRSTSLPESGMNYVAGSLVHHFQGPPPPWPERALAGPPWWIDLLCDIADAVDRQ